MDYLVIKNETINEDLAMEVDEYGTKKWKLDGLYHRLDEPAIIPQGLP